MDKLWLYLPTYIQDSLWACLGLWKQCFGPLPTFFCRKQFLESTTSSQLEGPSGAHVWLAPLNSKEGGKTFLYNSDFSHLRQKQIMLINVNHLKSGAQLTPKTPYLSHMVHPHRKSISKLWLRMMMTCSLPNLSTVAWSVYRVQSVPDHHSSSITSSAQWRWRSRKIRKLEEKIHHLEHFQCKQHINVLNGSIFVLHYIYINPSKQSLPTLQRIISIV